MSAYDSWHYLHCTLSQCLMPSPYTNNNCHSLYHTVGQLPWFSTYIMRAANDIYTYYDSCHKLHHIPWQLWRFSQYSITSATVFIIYDSCQCYAHILWQLPLPSPYNMTAANDIHTYSDSCHSLCHIMTAADAIHTYHDSCHSLHHIIWQMSMLSPHTMTAVTLFTI